MKVEIEIDRLAFDLSNKIDPIVLRQAIEQALAYPLQTALRGIHPARDVTVTDPIECALDSISETVISAWQREAGS